MNILLVDDEADVRKSISRFLEKLGHVVTCASDGMEALREFHLREINLVITDIRMPEIVQPDTECIETVDVHLAYFCKDSEI